MTLILHTARLSTRRGDVLNITRSHADKMTRAGQIAPGAFLAPSAALVYPTLRALKETEGDCSPHAEATRALIWTAYAKAYREEMRASYRDNRALWDALLARESATLVCYCVDPARCHRTLAAGYLARLGADYRAEVT